MLKAREVSYYSLRITLLAISERKREPQIESGAIVLGQFPLAFQFNVTDTVQGKARPRAHQCVAALRSLHEFIEDYLNLLAENTYCVLECQVKRIIRVLLYFGLTSYVADILKTQD